jgi:hypothetical protein
VTSKPGPIDAKSAAAGMVGVAGAVGGTKTKAAAGVVAAVTRAIDARNDAPSHQAAANG